MTSLTAPSTALHPDRVRDVVRRHFDPATGTPFWLERAAELPFDPRDRIRTEDDLPLLGPLTRDDLVGRPLRDLVPRDLWRRRDALRLAETGGTSGRPLRAVYSDAEFRAGFVRPFAEAVHRRGFPTAGTWAFVGPSGPHVIHQAARAFARDAGELEPVSVDFDPRWARAQTPGSFGAHAYREHVVDQAVWAIRQEDARVLFSTPPVLLALAERLSAEDRRCIGGIHVGGMPLDAPTREALRRAYCRAVILPAYGNSLAGIAPELVPPGDDGRAGYAVPCGRLRLRLVGDRADGVFDVAALRDEVPDGGRGRVVLDRLDPTFLLANLIERDVATAAPASDSIRALGYQDRVLVDPGPAAAVPVSGGLY